MFSMPRLAGDAGDGELFVQTFLRSSYKRTLHKKRLIPCIWLARHQAKAAGLVKGMQEEVRPQRKPWYRRWPLATKLSPIRDLGSRADQLGLINVEPVRIVYRIDRDFDGPRLMPVEPESAEAMGRMMRDIMGLHYGVLMYSRLLDEGGKSPVVVARGNFLREQRSKYPDRASVLDARIAGNERLQAGSRRSR